MKKLLRRLFFGEAMKKVKLKQVLMTIAVEATDDDYDIEIQESLYTLMQTSAKAMARVSDACNEALVAQLEGAADAGSSSWAPFRTQDDSQPRPAPPVSQEDPVINTAVTDREMSSSAPELSLEEFLERPAKTRAPPRPRTNSWRHKE